MNIITRAEAKALGLKRYFTGNPCKYGHVAERATVNGLCHECGRLKQLKAYYADREKNLRKQKIYRDSDPDRAAKKRARAYARDPVMAQRAALKQRNAAARDAAKAAGESQYISERPCPAGHVGLRFVHDSHCVECNRIKCRLRFGYIGRFALKDPAIASAKAAQRAARAEQRAAREAERAIRAKAWKERAEIGGRRHAAIASGDKTYLGSICRFGHDGLRYAKHGTCVQCAADHAASEEKKQYDLIYYGKHQERIRKRSKQYHEKHRDRYVAQAREWIKRNPEKRKAISMAHKAKRRAIEKDGDPTSVIFAWVQKAPKVCHWCGAKCKTKYHVDHYKPLSKGGKHEVSNLVIACPTCNLRKSAKDPLEFAASLGRLF